MHVAILAEHNGFTKTTCPHLISLMTTILMQSFEEAQDVYTLVVAISPLLPCIHSCSMHARDRRIEQNLAGVKEMTSK